MLSKIEFQNLGPVPHLRANFGSRLNIVTGDNGVGKTLLLDLAWFVLTRSWPDNRPALPNPDCRSATVAASLKGKTTEANFNASFAWSEQNWEQKEEMEQWRLGRGRKVMPGLVIYARIDGGFSVWDPTKHYWLDEKGIKPLATSLELTRKELWEGKKNEKIAQSLGMIADLDRWRLEQNEAWVLMNEVLHELSPCHREKIELGNQSVKLLSDDATRYPTLKTSVGLVPITQASAGVKRVLSLAYALVWAWMEHRENVTRSGKEVAERRMILLFDEVEAHLHPQWQRVLLPALLKVIQSKLLEPSAQLQVIATTHAPLVLASLEPHFDEKCDRLFNYHIGENRQVTFDQVSWSKHGDITAWLTSEMFDMESSYSVEAEEAMRAADNLMAGYFDKLPPDLTNAEQIHQALLSALGGADPWWPFWMNFYRRVQKK